MGEQCLRPQTPRLSWGFVLAVVLLADGARAASLKNICPRHDAIPAAGSAGANAAMPLTAGPDSHIVIMQYEAWFGPRTGVASQASVTTCLQSRDMQKLGGGYDSTDPALIAQHATWLEQAGADAITLDLTNNVSCIFDGDNPAIVAQTCPNALFRTHNTHIRDQDFGLYPAWSALHTRLKIIPLLGGFDAYALSPDMNDPRQRCALQKEADAFGALMRQHHALDVIYFGKPLMLIYLGTPVDPSRVRAINAMLHSSGLDQRYTFKLIAGYLDSQPQFWADPNETPTHPIRIAPAYGFWSIVDRLNFWAAPPKPYYPTYNKMASRVENMTASLATKGQLGWQCTANAANGYCPDAALRYCGEGYQNGCQSGSYETLHDFMVFARRLRPIFLIINQFNEFAEPDEGKTPNSNNDAEPTRQWGYSALRALAREIRQYRSGKT